METLTIDYEININDVECIQILEKNSKTGTNVQKGIWRNEVVCVKKIDIKHKNEVHILCKCIHPKICQFLGAHCTQDCIYILFEFMENGNLKDYLRNNVVNYKQRIKLMIDIAIGLHYLHNRQPQSVMHRDLKPENILISKCGDAKISDFGISKIMTATSTIEEMIQHSGEVGTCVWMAPEVMKQEKYNYKSDIFSFGLICYYIWTGKLPYNEQALQSIQLMYKRYTDELILDTTEISNFALENFICVCTDTDFNKRYNSHQCIQNLKNIYETI